MGLIPQCGQKIQSQIQKSHYIYYQQKYKKIMMVLLNALSLKMEGLLQTLI